MKHNGMRWVALVLLAAMMGCPVLANDKGEFAPGPAIDFIKRSCYDHERWVDYVRQPEQSVSINESSGFVVITRETSGDVWYQKSWGFYLKNVKINKYYNSGFEVICQTSGCISFNQLNWDNSSGEKALGERRFTCNRENTARAFSDLANYYGGGAKTPYD